ncbi:MAG: magnesium transporter [Microbacteriaceae bacterium]|nr:magnesium transporter [Microbacteriaceae bacterium]
MSVTNVYVARLSGANIFNTAGDRIGKVRDVLVVYRKNGAPRVVGFIVDVPGLRHIFLGIGRITSIESSHIVATGVINTRRFQQRSSEMRVIGELLGKRVRVADSEVKTIEDVSITLTPSGEWVIGQLYLRAPKTKAFSKGTTSLVSWNAAVIEDSPHPQSAEALIASYSELRAADLANTLLELPETRRKEVANELSDERLADVMEELPEIEQIDLISGLEPARAADVLDHMDPDDAADLIASLPENTSTQLLDLMDPEEAADVRNLLNWDADSAGGLMTTDAIVLSSDSTVAEGLAIISKYETDPTIAATIYITFPPYETPTGRFIGVVHFQTMLRYPPSTRLGALIDETVSPVLVSTPASEVAVHLATYNLISVPVVDQVHRLVGIVTIDDVLDLLLPEDWRTQARELTIPKIEEG